MSHNVHEVRSFDHPGEGRRRAKATPKGRQVDPTAAHEIEQLLGDRPRRRDLLIEYLHLIQDKYHQISAGAGIRVVRAPCVGRCDTAPAAEVGHNFVDGATVGNVLAAAKAGDTHAHLPDYVAYDKYVAGGG